MIWMKTPKRWGLKSCQKGFVNQNMEKGMGFLHDVKNNEGFHQNLQLSHGFRNNLARKRRNLHLDPERNPQTKTKTF